MAELLARPLEAAFSELPAAQMKGCFGAGLPSGARLRSKAGWTGDPDAS